MTLAVGTKLGPYEILAPIGAGGMGEVYRARDTRLGRQVAVKILPDAVAQDPRRAIRFETEARALAALSHPNILAIHDFGQNDGRLYTVTELLDGETLRDRMAGEPMAWRKAAELAAAIADGLASAHSAGIVHRDLKPENVFLTSDGRLKILDFGLAKSTEPVASDAVTLTSPPGGALSADGEIVGTLSYMAPEQLRGLNVDGRTDIFALGSVLYEMLSGKRPFSGDTSVDTISAILHGEPEPLNRLAPAVPLVLTGIVSRCLEKRPEDRYDTAHDLAIGLRSISSDQQLAAKPEEKPRPVPRRRLAIAAAIAAAAVLVALAALAIYFKSLREPTRNTFAATSWDPPRQATSTPGWEGEPALSPDGTLVAYTSNASGNIDIWLVDPGKGEPVRVTDGPGENRKPAWFPDGRALAFASTRGGRTSIWKVAREGESATLLVENGDMPAVSPDGSLIAFCRAGTSGALRIWIAPLSDPAQASPLTSSDGGAANHADPVFSPDGRTVCFSDAWNLWLVPARGGPARQLTRDNAWDREPVFSPDGGTVFFNSRRSDPPSLYRVDLSGGAPERVLQGTGPANHPSLAADGRRLAFSTLSISRDVVVINRKSGKLCRFSSSRNVETPALSPDGRSVVYVSNRIGKYDLWVEELQSGCPGKKPARRLTNLETGPSAPAFSPDGRWVAFFRVVKDWTNIWAVPTEGGEPIPLMESPAKDLHPAYSPDGIRLAFVSNRSGQYHVWILPLRAGLPAGEPWRLTDGESQDELPAWSPDGKRLAFLRGDDLWLVDVEKGATPRRITTDAGAHHLAWEPDGSSILLSGLFQTPVLEVQRVSPVSGAHEPLKPRVVLGDRDGAGYVSLSHDGRFLATDIAERRGNIWITTASREGR